MLKLLVFGLTLLSMSQAWKTYRGYRTYKVTPNTEGQLQSLRYLLSEDTSIEWDVWKPSYGVGDEAHVMVSPEKCLDFVELMVKNGLSLDIHTADVGDDVAAFKARMDARRKPDGRLDFDLNDYNTFEDTYAQMDVWAGTCPSEITCQVQSIGNSYEGEEVLMFTISSGEANNEKIYIDSLTHPREMLGGTAVNNIINKLVADYGSDPDVTYILDNYDVFLVPIVNPDGYKYIWSDNNLWRKNREPNNGSVCVGTDINRNFDTGFWGNDGTSDNPCSNVYCGSEPASAIETRNVQDFLYANSPKIMISIHAYADLWLHSYGHTLWNETCARADNHQDMMDAGQAAIDAIMDTGGQSWVAGTVCETFYAASGGTVDYAHRFGSSYTYTPELRGDNFRPNETEIQPAFEETWAGIVALVEETESHIH